MSETQFYISMFKLFTIFSCYQGDKKKNCTLTHTRSYAQLI